MIQKIFLPGALAGATLLLPGFDGTVLPPPSDPCACTPNPSEDDGEGGVLASRDMIPVPGHQVPVLSVTPKINSTAPGECGFDDCPGGEDCR